MKTGSQRARQFRSEVLFLAVELAEHFVVAFASLFVAILGMIGTTQHLVDFHSAAAVLRRTGRAWLCWRWCSAVVRRVEAMY